MMICVAINDILCRNQTLLLHVMYLSDGIGKPTVLVKISSAGAFNLTLLSIYRSLFLSIVKHVKVVFYKPLRFLQRIIWIGA